MSKGTITLIKILVLFFMGVIACSCSRRTIPVITNTVEIRDSVSTDTLYIARDTTIYLPGDTLQISEAIPCPDVVVDRRVKAGNITATVHLRNGLLNVDCMTDSLMRVITTQEQRIRSMRTRSEKTTTQVPYEVIKYRVPKWCWWLLIANVLYIGFMVYRWKTKARLTTMPW